MYIYMYIIYICTHIYIPIYTIYKCIYTFLSLYVYRKSNHLLPRTLPSKQRARPVPAAAATWKSAPQYIHTYIIYTHIDIPITI